MTKNYFENYYQKVLDKVLSEGEKVEHNFFIGDSYRKIMLIIWIIIAIPFLFLAGFGVIIILFVLFFFGFYLKVANVYAFTNRRVIIHTGWLSTKTKSISYDKITDITVKEGIFEKIITKTGSLIINTAGTSQYEVVLSKIEKPYELKKILEKIKSKY